MTLETKMKNKKINCRNETHPDFDYGTAYPIISIQHTNEECLFICKTINKHNNIMNCLVALTHSDSVLYECNFYLTDKFL